MLLGHGFWEFRAVGFTVFRSQALTRSGFRLQRHLRPEVVLVAVRTEITTPVTACDLGRRLGGIVDCSKLSVSR